MSVDSRIKKKAAIFGNWIVDGDAIGDGTGRKNFVYKLKRGSAGWEEYSALKVIPLTEEYGSWDQLSLEQQNSYGEMLFQKTQKAKEEIITMEKLRGNTHIVDYLDFDFVDWSGEDSFGRDMYIRMELLRDLRTELKHNRIFSEREIIKVGCDICKALSLCHSKGIIHRDIKPDNIFVNKDGNYKLGDFGISKSLPDFAHGYSGTGIGTFAYMPAEQLKGKYNKIVDIYSLGMVLYELSNGNKLPFAKEQFVSDQEVIQRLSGQKLPSPSNASTKLAEVILKACAFNPKERYASAEEFLSALENLLITDGTGSDSKPSHKYVIIAICVVAICAVIGGIFRTIRADGPHETIPETVLETECAEITVPSEITVEETIPITTQETLPVRVVEDPDRIVSVDVNASHIAAVYADGTVDAIYFNEDYFNTRSDVQKWRDIVAVSAGNQHTVGLRSDGTVVAAGFNTYGECDVSDWSDIVEITAGYCFTAGLKSDGTVVYTGYNNLSKLYDVSDLTGVIAIDSSHASGRALDCLLSDGTWIRRGHVGGDEWGNSEKMYTFVDVAADENGYISKAGDIIDISTGTACSVGLKANGTVKLIRNLKLDGYSGYHKPDILMSGAFDASSWRNIVAVSANREHVVGLRKDGTVAFTGPLDSRYKQHYDMSDWTNITGIYAGGEYIIGLTEDGTLLAAGMTYIADGEWERLDVSALNRKVTIEEGTSYNDMYPNHTTDAEGFVLIDNSDAAQDELCILGYKVSNGLEIQNPYCYSNESMIEVGFAWKDNTEIAQTLIGGGRNHDFSQAMVDSMKNTCITMWENEVWFGNHRTPENNFSSTFSFVPEETYYALLLCFDRSGEYTAYAVLKIGYPIS